MSRFLTKLSGSNTPDVESTLIKLRGKATSTKPNDPLKPHYTLPAILDESGAEPVTVVDSLHIAEYLNEKFPERSVIPKKGKALEYIFEEIFKTTVGAHFPLLPPTCGVQKKRNPTSVVRGSNGSGKSCMSSVPKDLLEKTTGKTCKGASVNSLRYWTRVVLTLTGSREGVNLLVRISLLHRISFGSGLLSLTNGRAGELSNGITGDGGNC